MRLRLEQHQIEISDDRLSKETLERGVYITIPELFTKDLVIVSYILFTLI